MKRPRPVKSARRFKKGKTKTLQVFIVLGLLTCILAKLYNTTDTLTALTGIVTVAAFYFTSVSVLKHISDSVRRNKLSAAVPPAYHNMLFNVMAHIVKSYFDQHHPDYTNRGRTSLGNLDRDGWEDLCNAIIELAFKDKFFMASLDAINKLDRFTNNTVIVRSKVQLRNLMMTEMQKNMTYFKYWINYSLKNKKTSIPILDAQANKVANKGIFKDHFISAYDEMKKDIMGLINRNGEPHDFMTEAEAARIMVSILEQYGLAYLYFFSIDELTALALHYVWNREDDRDKSVQKSVNKHKRNTGRADIVLDNLSSAEAFAKLHPQEKNELVTMLDYIIKSKATIHELIRLLKNGQAIPLTLYDPDFKDFVTDVYVLLPTEVEYEICQGTAALHFGDYHEVFGHGKQFDEGRYIVGLTSARVFDAYSPQVNVMYNGEFVGGRGIHLHGLRFIREITYTEHSSVAGHLNVKVSGHVISLHRLVGMMLSHYETSVFSEGVLESIGIHLDDGNYDHHFIYYHDDNNSRSFERALRQGVAYSLQCDWDHRCGKDYRYLHGALFGAPTSHRMNSCFVHVRSNAKHWLFGLIYQPYINGVESSDGDNDPLPLLEDLLSEFPFPTAADVARGSTYEHGFNYAARNPLELLPAQPSLYEQALNEADCEH